ncbi:MAG: ATP-binding protein [Janthinobacterium lividum]
MRQQLRTRLTLWYVLILAIILIFYLCLVFAFQYASIKRQIYHDEVQDVETVEGLLTFNSDGTLQLQQGYFSNPRSHLLIDRLMEVRDLSGTVLYRSPALGGMTLGGPLRKGEGEDTFDEREIRVADGNHVFLISHTHPVQGRLLVIRLGYSLALFWDRMRQFLSVLLIALPATLLLAGVAGYVIAKRALRPLEQMAAEAETISASNLNQRLEVQNPDDELGQMARMMNHLLERLEQAFVQLQRFTADAAHELRTPLASIRSVGELALRAEDRRPELYQEAIGSILEEASVLNQTIEDLLLLARAEAAQPGVGQTSFSVVALLSEVLSVLEVLIEEKGLSIDQYVQANVLAIVHADRGLVRSAMMNILHNAVKFSPASSHISLRFAEIGSEPGFVEMSVTDQGPGIRASERDRVFDRFFTSSAHETSSMAGSGIGLSIARLAIERSGGEIFFDLGPEKGARCVIRLPLVG